MYTFVVKDPDQGLRDVIQALREEALFSDSRNGRVARFPRPVCLEYLNPTKRLLTSPVRNSNPFFHLFETMWMFGGLSELKPLLFFNSQMAQYSDDGKSLRGTAYGHRWRVQWGDQLLTAIAKFKANPDERRVVVSMWDPIEHNQMVGKDFACNLQVLFSTRPSLANPESRILDMTVTNRSNDIVYGALGSNVFHFSMLLEYMALHCGFEIGTYYQISNNLHLYTEHDLSKKVWDNWEQIESDLEIAEDHSLTDLKLTLDRRTIAKYVLDTGPKPEDPYLAQVVRPMVEAYKIYKLKSSLDMDIPISSRYILATDILRGMKSPLGAAGIKWLNNSPATRKAKV